MTPPQPIPAPIMVTAREHLEEIVADLLKEPRVAVDIESNGFYAYRERVCLIQLSDSSYDYVVDPIAIKDVSALGKVWAHPGIEKIFHAGEHDLICMKRDYAFEFANVFDTMIAGRLLGYKELGLAAAIERHFGVKISKKYQRSDWGRRPLEPEQIRYAQMDTHFLIALTDIQRELLSCRSRLEDATEAFENLTRIRPPKKSFDPEGFWCVAGSNELSGVQLSALRELYIKRESLAESKNRAPFRIMPEELLMRVAKAMPDSHEKLKAVRGMTPYLLERYSDALLDAVADGRKAEPIAPDSRPRSRRDPREARVFEALRQWRKGKAEEEKIEPVAIIPSDGLWDIAKLAAQKAADPLSGLSALKRRRYEVELMKVLGQTKV